MKSTIRPKGELISFLIVVVAFVAFATRLFLLISRYAVNIFFSDQWEFNDATLFQRHSIWQMFAWQHGPHRQGLGALFSRLVDPLSQWNSRTESFIVGGVVVVAAICALWLRRRLYGPFSVFDVVIPAVFFIPAQWETLFMTANFAHGPFPLLLVVLYCLAWTCDRKVLQYSLVVLINFLAIYTGFGLFLGVLTPILLVLDYWAAIPDRRLPRTYFVGALIVSLISLGSFFLGYKFNADLDCFSPKPQSPSSYLFYMALMFAHIFAVKGTRTLARIVGITILSVLLVSLASAIWPLLRRQNPSLTDQGQKRGLITMALIAYSLLFSMNTAYGRLCGGLATALAPRYVIYLELGVLGLYFHLLSIRQVSMRRLLLSAFLVTVLAASVQVDRRRMEYFRAVRQRWKECYLQTEDIKRCDQVAGFPIFTHPPERTHLQEKLQYLKKTHQNLYLDSR
jgi:hypothetical protein